MMLRLFSTVLLGFLVTTFVATDQSMGQVLFSENFEGMTLMENIEEGILEDMPFDAAWSNVPPEGWSIDNLDTPEGGVTEFRGWNFVDPIWWANVDNQQRDQFFLFSDEGTGDVIAVADGDEWDDKPHPEGLMNTLLSTPQVPVSNGSDLVFETSWRAEAPQTATITASYDGAAPVEILRWESDGDSEFFEGDLNPGTVEVPVNAPAGAENVSFNFGYVGGNNWWWAVDNISYGGFSEDFESVELQTNVDEGRVDDERGEVWTNIPPEGWSRDDEVPGMDEDMDNNGTDEWIGWSFADKQWWTDVAGDQRRSEFTNGKGIVMVADPDEWDDNPHPDSASEGWFNTFMTTPEISIDGVEADSITLKFDSSWRPEFDDNYQQTGSITVSFDGGAEQELLLWESDSESDNFKDDDSTNETIELRIPNPEGASNMVLTFGLFDAGNDWWWAIDNIEVLGAGGGDACDFDGDGVLGLGDINLLLAQVNSGANDLGFDINSDGAVTADDVIAFVTGGSKLNSYVGDVNLDGEFNSSDLVGLFEAGEFEDGVEDNSTWATGDFDGDGDFGTGDLVAAFADGGFELGPKGVATVPEPTGLIAVWITLLVGLRFRRRK